MKTNYNFTITPTRKRRDRTTWLNFELDHSVSKAIKTPCWIASLRRESTRFRDAGAWSVGFDFLQQVELNNLK